jgi:hypothetical protein
VLAKELSALAEARKDGLHGVIAAEIFLQSVQKYNERGQYYLTRLRGTGEEFILSTDTLLQIAQTFASFQDFDTALHFAVQVELAFSLSLLLTRPRLDLDGL